MKLFGETWGPSPPDPPGPSTEWPWPAPFPYVGKPLLPPPRPSRCGSVALCMCSSFMGVCSAVSIVDLRTRHCQQQRQRRPHLEHAHLLAWEEDSPFPSFQAPLGARKESKINISINYPATFVYSLNVGTVYLPFKLLLSSAEQSILSQKIYHREITCRGTSRNVRFLN